MVGPRAVPLIVGVGLVLVGFWVAVEAVTGKATVPTSESDDADPALPTDWRAVGLLAVALILYLLLMRPTGFVPASTILFAAAAFAMGSRRTLRDLILGLLFSLLLYLAFTAGLGLRLPLGFLEGLR
jgi:putative tricarboxylic transport membrane protein